MAECGKLSLQLQETHAKLLLYPLCLGLALPLYKIFVIAALSLQPTSLSPEAGLSRAKGPESQARDGLKASI